MNSYVIMSHFKYLKTKQQEINKKYKQLIIGIKVQITLKKKYTDRKILNRDKKINNYKIESNVQFEKKKQSVNKNKVM